MYIDKIRIEKDCMLLNFGVVKIKAIKYYYKINNYSNVCKIFECSERSLKRWVERYNQNENVERKNRKQVDKLEMKNKN